MRDMSFRRVLFRFFKEQKLIVFLLSINRIDRPIRLFPTLLNYTSPGVSKPFNIIIYCCLWPSLYFNFLIVSVYLIWPTIDSYQLTRVSVMMIVQRGRGIVCIIKLVILSIICLAFNPCRVNLYNHIFTTGVDSCLRDI